jgi:hypothetical protein
MSINPLFMSIKVEHQEKKMAILKKHLEKKMETYRFIIRNRNLFSNLDEILPKIKRKWQIKTKSGTVYRVAEVSSFIPYLKKGRYRLLGVSSEEESIF